MLHAVGWVIFVAAIGTLIFATMRDEIKEPGVWMLWGAFIGGMGVAGGILLLEATK